MKVLIIDGGGRGHAWGWKLAQSPRVSKLYFAPGNGGTESIGENVPIGVKEVDRLLAFVEKESIDLAAVGSDDSLAAGVVDAFQAHGRRIFGPTRAAAEVEWSKSFAKQLMWPDVPTAPFQIFTDCVNALAYINVAKAPIVVKATGLALGKGAYPCKTILAAQRAVADCMIYKLHKAAGEEIVVEKFLPGREYSVHAWCDGEHFSLFPPAKDHKPAFDGNPEINPNTGGMATFSGVPWVSARMMQEEVGGKIVGPILRKLGAMNRPYKGIIYPGLMENAGQLNVLELNARPGDTEWQTYMRRLLTDPLPIMEACIDGKLDQCPVEWSPKFSATIVAASGGYPGSYKKLLPITGINEAEKVKDVVVFHAGTRNVNGMRVPDGGRVLNITALGDTLDEVLEKAYEAINYIKFEGMFYRREIAVEERMMAQS